MPRRLLVAILSSLLVVTGGALAAAPAAAATGTGSISGRLVDSGGAPVADQTIRFAAGGSDVPYRAYDATSDASGAYRVAGVPAGSYATVLASGPWMLATSPSASVSAGAEAGMPTLTLLRAATVHGRIVSATDGSPVAGVGAYAAGNGERTAADGTFSFRVLPGLLTLWASGELWFGASRTAVVGEGTDHDFGTVALDPAGVVSTSILGASGRAIGNAYQSAVVDGCRVSNAVRSACPGVELMATVSSLQVAPGRHTIRYEVRSPVGAAARGVTRTVDVEAGSRTALPQVVVPIVDPNGRAVVDAGTYRRGHPVTLRIHEATYVDGARLRMPVTIRVSGHVVRPTSARWRTSGAGVLVATLPKRWSERRSLTVRVIVRGDSVHAIQTSAPVRLVRAR